jgi:hypothetical protein
MNRQAWVTDCSCLQPIVDGFSMQTSGGASAAAGVANGAIDPIAMESAINISNTYKLLLPA